MKIYSANTDAPTGQIVDMGCKKFLGRYVRLESAKAACQKLEDDGASKAGADSKKLDWASGKSIWEPFLMARSEYEYSFEIHQMDVED